MRALLVVAFAFPLIAAKKPEPQWQTGKVLDSRSVKSSVPVGSTTSTTGTATATGGDGVATASGQSTSSTSVEFANIRDNQLVILGSEFGYVVEDARISGGHGVVGVTAHAIANRKHGCRFYCGRRH